MKPKLLFLLFFLILALAACSPGTATEVVFEVETVVVTEIIEGEPVEVIITTIPMPRATAAPEISSEELALMSGEPGNAALNDEPGSSVQQISAPQASRMVIKDAEMEILVRDTDQALANVTQMAFDYGGYIISSQTWYDGDFKYANMRLAVPSTAFETALNNLRILGLQVLRETASGQDVSAEYVDLHTRLANLEATAARVREFLAEAKTVEESLKVSAELSELEGQIEQIKGQMGYYEGRAAYSTVTVVLSPQRPTPTSTLTPTPTPTPTATPGWDPGETFQEATGTLITISQSTIDSLIWFAVVVGPFLIILVVLLWSYSVSRRRKVKSAPTE